MLFSHKEPVMLYFLPIVPFLAFYILWFFYLAIMNLKRAKESGKLNKTATYLGAPLLVIGYILDFLVNIFLTIPFLELPHEFTVTARLKRHVCHSIGWRKSLACFFIPLLDPFDPSGKHITD
jgi:hypothetical protein